MKQKKWKQNDEALVDVERLDLVYIDLFVLLFPITPKWVFTKQKQKVRI